LGQTISNDGKAIEVGTRFVVTANGLVSGVKFYKGADANTYVVRLWDGSGKALASTTVNNTTLGFFTVNFSTPVNVVSGSTYTVSFYSPGGNYAANATYFNTYVPSGSLVYLGGFYLYGAGFPTGSFQKSYYYVDPVFTANAKDTVFVRDTVKVPYIVRDTMTLIKTEFVTVFDTLYVPFPDTLWFAQFDTTTVRTRNTLVDMDVIEFSLPNEGSYRFHRFFSWRRQKFVNGEWITVD
jgi:hypothetical protein